MTVSTQTDIFLTHLEDHTLEVTVTRQTFTDIVTLEEDGTPILQVFFRHGHTSQGEIAIGELVDKLKDGFEQVRQYAIGRAAAAGAERVHGYLVMSGGRGEEGGDA